MKSHFDIAAAVRAIVARAPSDATLVEDLQREVGRELLADADQVALEQVGDAERRAEDIAAELETMGEEQRADQRKLKQIEDELATERKRALALSHERHALRLRCEEKDAALQALLDVAARDRSGHPVGIEAWFAARDAARAAIVEASAPNGVQVASLALPVTITGVGILGDDDALSVIELRLHTGKIVAIPAPMDECARAGAFLMQPVTAELLVVAPAEAKDGKEAARG